MCVGERGPNLRQTTSRALFGSLHLFAWMRRWSRHAEVGQCDFARGNKWMLATRVARPRGAYGTYPKRESQERRV